MTGRRAPADIRFWSKVEVPADLNDCWEFLGTPGSTQAWFRVNGQTITAGRMMLRLIGVEAPLGMVICHSCDNAKCCNPDHLWLGTQKDNIRDMHSKGRDYNGKDKITHCPSGHEYTFENTRIYRRKRYCRACSREKHQRNASQRKS
jgi:hypothetical protein